MIPKIVQVSAITTLVLASPARAEVPALTPPPGARVMIGLADLDGVAVSPTGAVLAVFSKRDGLQLIDVTTGRGITRRADLVCKEKDPLYPSCSAYMTFTTDGKRLAVWWPGLAKLVVVAVPSAKTEFQATAEDVSKLAFLDDGRLLAGDLYETTGKKRAFPQPKYFSGVSPDGKRFVGSDGRVIDGTGKVLAQPPQGGQIFDLVLGRDPSTLVGSQGAGYPNIVTWRPGDTTARTLVASDPKDTDEAVNSFAFPAPFDRVFVALGTGLVAVTLDGKRVFRSNWVTRAQLSSISRSASEVVAVAYRCPYRVDAKGDLIPGRIFCAARPHTLAFDERGDQLFAIPWDSSGIMTFDAKTGSLISARLKSPPYPTGAVLSDPALAAKAEGALAKAGVKAGSYELSPDGKTLFASGLFSDNAIIDLATNRARKGLEAFVVSGDGKRIAIARKDDEKLIDVRTVDGDRLVRTLPMPTTLTDRSALSYDGSVFAAEGDGRVPVLDVATGKLLFEAPCQGSYTGHVELSRDGRLLVCDTGGATVVYDVRAKKLVKRVEHPWASADTFALSRDGKQLAISAENIVIVDVK